ncbi:MAG: TonB-dependent receptor [Polyangiales bacterium]
MSYRSLSRSASLLCALSSGACVALASSAALAQDAGSDAGAPLSADAASAVEPAMDGSVAAASDAAAPTALVANTSDAGVVENTPTNSSAAPTPVVRSVQGEEEEGVVVGPRRARSRPPARPGPRRATQAAEPEGDEGVTVMGSLARTLEQTPGSVTLVRNEDLRAVRPQHAGDMLRNVPGVHVVPEDGLGMRLNISIRGLDPNRSRKVLILEDGIPLTLNPYGSPELYYSPPIERMDRIEVVRGSGQILFGPQTVGGVINYISAEPPRGLMALANVRGGNLGYFIAHAAGGLTQGALGVRLDVLHRRFNGPRLPDAQVTNVTGRLRARFSARSTLNVKFDFYDEQSGATYVGPTTAQFAADPTFNPAIHDRFLVRRYALSIWHDWIIAPGLRLHTAAYGYETHRAWRRQNFERADSGANYERVCDAFARCGPRGDAGVMATDDGSSLFFRQDASIRDRHFLVGGIEPRLTWRWSANSILSGELTTLVRAHYEQADERLLRTTTPTDVSGETIDGEVRNGYAFAAAIQNRFSFWRKLHVTPGLRVETFASDRRISRVADSMNATRGMDVNVFGQSLVWALIPGIGVTFEPRREFTVYGGFHRGFSPPRTKDAVSNAGLNLRLDPELSWNYELGARARLGRWLEADAAAFWIEFDNQIIPPSESGGAVSAAGFNTGHSRHIGLEASVTVDPAQFFLPPSVKLPIIVNYTYLPVAMLLEGLFIGNRVPYAPQHMLNAQLRFMHSSGVLLQTSVNLISSQFTDKDNTQSGSRNGLIGEIPTYVTLDARVAYTWRSTGLTFAVSGRNLTDQVYIASRAPQGVQAAGYRQVFAELEWRWPGQ